MKNDGCITVDNNVKVVHVAVPRPEKICDDDDQSTM